MKIKSIPLALAAAGIIIGAGSAGAAGWKPSDWFQAKTALASPAPQAAAQPAATDAIAPMSAPNYRAIVQRFGPAVVGINTEGHVKAARRLPDADDDDPFSQFFGMPAPRGRGPQAEVPVMGQGSGFIIDGSGLILTNAHVVADADEVTVKLSDRREFKAKVLGSDRQTDVAVLKINADNLPVVRLGDPRQLQVGDYVLAIGSPFGFEQSATSGIVSAKGRSLPGDAYVPFIQTDVAVNPGNSGGPLFDAAGNVVGINSQIYSRTGGYMGVSFSIPIDVALKVKDQIVSTGKVRHARLGVTVQDVNQPLADSFKLSQPGGALVSSVSPGSAAAKAGLQPGDVVLKFNDRPIDRSGDLSALVGMSAPGDKARLEVWRGGKNVELNATLAGASDQVAAADNQDGAAPQGRLGVAVRPLTPEEGRQAKLASGLVIEQASGPAARAGLAAGDIIVSVNGAPVNNPGELQRMVAKEKQLAVLVQRGDARIFVPVRLG
ncbi:serine protease Do [Noviherbaspirillum humi]|uniref:Probable periplasmic serine endoprotease DegP-like n=1 Tax=Noviherbaspirillum humi TaxID=1688639 RepID=A0A239E663_9BURK|nr:DegQ family serine endoprotease [Noviherbaspirillum humi]SNS40146.1 serine protease Do [Noviherbaspirillum humi]